MLIEPILIKNVLKMATAYADATGYKLARISRWANGDPPFLDRLMEGKGTISAKSYDRAVMWFNREAKWPEGTKCPAIREPFGNSKRKRG